MAIPSYIPTEWENGVTPINEDNLNKIEEQLEVVTDGVNDITSEKDETTVTGTSLTLTDCVADTCKVKSNSKNLFYGSLRGTGNSINYVLDGSELTFNGTSTSGYNIIDSVKLFTLPAGTYNISMTKLGGSFNVTGSTGNITIASASSGAALMSATLEEIASGKNTSVTLNATTDIYIRSYANTGITYNNLVVGIQIEEGDTATSYNPFYTKVTLINSSDTYGNSVILRPQEEKTAFTYDGETEVTSNGSIDVTYNTQPRLLNNDDVLDIVEPLKEYVDREIDNRKSSYASYSGTTGTLQTITGTTPTTITNMSVNIKTTGKPLFVATSFFAKASNTSYSALAQVYVDGVQKVGRLNTIISTSDIPYTGMVLLDNIPAGNHTIEIKIAGENANSNITLPTWYTRYLNVWEIN